MIQTTSITLRLSNGRDRSIEFTANCAPQLAIECKAAWASYRAQVATPEFFAAQQRLNELRHIIQPDLDGSNKARKISEWLERGHSQQNAEALWESLLINRKAQLAAAEQRERKLRLPDYLELHVDSVGLPGQRWWNPARAVAGVRVSADMTLLALTHSGRQSWSWERLWAAINAIRQHELALMGLGAWICNQVPALTQVKPSLTLISCNLPGEPK